MHTALVALSTFRRQVKNLLSAEEQFKLERYLAVHPQAGAVIPGTGGLRKARWGRAGLGKRSGVRVIYYYYVLQNTVYLMAVYAKSQQVDLTPEQKKELRRILGTIKGG